VKMAACVGTNAFRRSPEGRDAKERSANLRKGKHMNSEEKPSMGVGRKIFVVAASFSLPIAVLVYFVIVNINRTIDFTRMEMIGNAYQRPLEGLLRHIEQHQILLHHVPAGSDSAAALDAEKRAADKALDDLKDATEKYGVTLKFTDEELNKRQRQGSKYETVEKDWRDIEAAAGSGKQIPAGIDAKYGDVVAVLRTMITHMGDISNLILDPELDTYYTTSNTLVNLPQTQDRLAQVIALGSAVIARGSMTIAERTQLAVYASMLQADDLDVINSNTQTALNEDPNFHGTSASLQANVPPVWKNFQAAQTHFIELTKQLAASSGKPTLTVDEYISAGVTARESSFRFWDVSIQELDVMLDHGRIQDYDTRKIVALLLSALALFIACILAYWMTLSITNPLMKLARTLGPGAALLRGSIEQINEETNKGKPDPQMTAVICGELSAHVDDMNRSVQALQSIVFGATSPTVQS